MSQKICLTWDDNPLIWKLNSQFKWDDVCIIEKVEGGLSSGFTIPKKDPIPAVTKDLTDNEKNRFIQLVCEVNGMVYREKKRKSIEKSITIDHINKTIESVKDIKLDIYYNKEN